MRKKTVIRAVKKKKTNQKQEDHQPKLFIRMQNRLFAFYGLICILFVFIIGRIIYIELKSGPEYEKKVLAQQNNANQTIPYQRGRIEDRNGTVLAASVDMYKVIIDCKALNDDRKTIKARKKITINAVKKYFPEVDADRMVKELTEYKNSRYRPLRSKEFDKNNNQMIAKVTADEKEAFEKAFKDKIVNGKNKMPDKKKPYGIWFEKVYKRIYPYDSLAASVIGFTSSQSGEGSIGLEREYDSILKGVNGRSYGFIDSDRNVQKTVVEPEDGKTIVTTLDANIQMAVEEEIQNWNNQHLVNDGSGETKKLGSQNTACIVMNPNNGEILAMASYPGFNLNNNSDLSNYTIDDLKTISDENRKSVRNNIPISDDKIKENALNSIWQAYPITNSFEPGSIFKPVTISAGLDTGTVKTSDSYYCDGGEQIGNNYVPCWYHAGHGQETVEDALKNSCNDALMQMSAKIGPDYFSKYQRLFGFGQKTNVDLPGEADTSKLLFTKDQLGSYINLATNSFGQNFNLTMIQMAAAYSSIINGGKLYQPHFLYRVEDAGGNVIRKVDPVVRQTTISKDTSDLMKQYLRTVVRAGTGTKTEIEGYSVAGKTGTAQKSPKRENHYVISFIGDVPAEDPQIVIFTIIDVPNVGAESACHGTLEINKAILERIIPYLNIPSEEEEAASGITVYDSLYPAGK